MKGTGKYYALLFLLTAALLLFIPYSLLPKAEATTPVGTAPTFAPADDSRPSTFTVLHADGKSVGSISRRDLLVYTLAAEMPASFESEALKAQAVASYTYFCYERSRERETPSEALCGADIADVPVPYPEGYTEAYWREKWGDDAYDAYYPLLTAAVDAVAGEQILYDGEPIFAAYHAISSGVTEQPDVVWANAFPYLQSVASPADALAPQYESELRLTAEELRKKLESVDGPVLADDPSVWLGQPQTSAAGTVVTLPIGGTSLSGGQWRELLGLRSACFTVAYENGAFVFRVQGYGHGVGMSQYGAQQLALCGYDYREILRYYYTDVTVA